MQYRGKEYIDFFVELDYMPESRPAILKKNSNPYSIRQNYIGPLIMNFFECFNKDLIKQCVQTYGDRIRFHYADVRSGVIHSGTEPKLKTQIDILKSLYHVFYKNDFANMTTQHVRLINTFLEHYEQFDTDYFFKLGKIDKQLKKINRPTINELFKENFAQHILKSETINTIKTINQFLYEFGQAKLLKQSFEMFDDELDPYVGLMILLSPLFDLYTLARILRHDMKQVIVYAGDAHIRNLRALLLQLGYKETASKQSKDEETNFQCIDLSGVTQPWFV